MTSDNPGLVVSASLQFDDKALTGKIDDFGNVTFDIDANALSEKEQSKLFVDRSVITINVELSYSQSSLTSHAAATDVRSENDE